MITLRSGNEGYIAQALDSQADAVSREARTRQNQGPHLADHRKHLRLRAQILRAEAASIRDQLKARNA
jgi:hypothetical protein